MQEIFGFGAVIALLASLIAFWKLQTTTPSPPGDEETDSTEVSPSAVTPAPSPLGDEETDSTEVSPSAVTPAPSPLGDEETKSDWLGVGCSVGGIMLCGFLICCVIAISMLGNALGEFLEGVEDFFNVFENLFKGG